MNFENDIHSNNHFESRNFSTAIRGPACQFTSRTIELASSTANGGQRFVRKVGPTKENIELASSTANGGQVAFSSALDKLDGQFSKNELDNYLNDDTTISARWKGLAHIARAILGMGNKQESQEESRKEAKAAFDEAWDMSEKLSLSDWNRVDALSADSADSAKTADAGRFEDWNNALSPWTYGSWMVWDAVLQINQADAPKSLVTERTPILLDGGTDGKVILLAVELLPGPAGLVTPNWWQLGLTSFPSNGGADKYFFGAIQRAMSLAMPPHIGYRARWHLVSTTHDLDVWNNGLSGRSCEAAAACAVSAATERISGATNGRTNDSSVLDTRSAVTALLCAPANGDVRDACLEPVDGNSLASKFRAAQRNGLDTIVVSDQQSLEGIKVPSELRIAKAATLGAALDELREVNRAFQLCNQNIWNAFDQDWTEEPTPEPEAE